jgi:ketosteroid isomerase-like protein
MKNFVRAVLLAVVLVTVVPSIALAGAVEDELNRLEEARYAALIGADWQAFDALLADDFIYNTAGGAFLSKSGLIEYLKSGVAVVKKAVRENAVVRDYGDIALVAGVAHVDAIMKGEDKTLHSRYLHVWRRQGDTWRLVARQATYLPEKK